MAKARSAGAEDKENNDFVVVDFTTIEDEVEIAGFVNSNGGSADA